MFYVAIDDAEGVLLIRKVCIVIGWGLTCVLIVPLVRIVREYVGIIADTIAIGICVLVWIEWEVVCVVPYAITVGIECFRCIEWECITVVTYAIAVSIVPF